MSFMVLVKISWSTTWIKGRWKAKVSQVKIKFIPFMKKQNLGFHAA